MTDPIAAAVEALYLEHADRVRKHVYRKTSDWRLAEDVTQQTFLRLLAVLREGAEVRHNSGYLFRIAHNLVIDYYRARERAWLVSLDEIQGDMVANVEKTADQWMPDVNSLALMADPVDLATGVIERLASGEAIRRASYALTEQQAMVIQLRWFDGYSFAETAGMVGKPEGAVKALQHRALENMRRVTAT